MTKGNRPSDVCAMCDRPIGGDLVGFAGLHMYLGRGWVHGGGRECIPVHHGCAWLGNLPENAPVRPQVITALWGRS